MKMINTIYRVALFSVSVLPVLSCNKFLDEMPDSRTELDTPEKISQILVSAYTDLLPVTLQELRSDNVVDYGNDIDVYQAIFDQVYRCTDVTGESFDSPTELWNRAYNSIASANHALQAIEDMGNPESLNPQKGEALLCRAYGHFIIVNTFCQAYNAESSETDLGIPYVTEPETTVYVDYTRGSVANVYARIAEDIEAGYPLIDDTAYDQVKWHFNSAAAAAFAAQFYLYYGDYEKSIDYATAAIGDDPTGVFRNWSLYTGTSSDEYANTFASAEEAANFMLQSSNSLYARYMYGRYIVTQQHLENNIFSMTPWGHISNTDYGVTYYTMSRSYFSPKFNEYFIYSDIVAGIGQPYIVYVVFSAEKTMIDRAEANVLAGNYEAAVRDLNYFYASLGLTGSCTLEQISDFYADPESEDDDLYNILALAPKGMTLTEGTEVNMIRACLHARRIMTVHEGTRLQDLKRYGVAYTHEIDGEAPVNLQPYDPRLAVQLPNAVVSAGLEPNPTE